MAQGLFYAGQGCYVAMIRGQQEREAGGWDCQSPRHKTAGGQSSAGVAVLLLAEGE